MVEAMIHGLNMTKVRIYIVYNWIIDIEYTADLGIFIWKYNILLIIYDIVLTVLMFFRTMLNWQKAMTIDM